MSEILLIRTNSESGMLPNGILYLSSYLEKFGYKTMVMDLTFQEIEDDVWDSIKCGEIKIVGISMLSNKRKEPYELIRKIRSLKKDIKIIIGGMHAAAVPKLLVEKLPIDAAVIGEGELTMKELADLWIAGVGDIRKIKGIATREFGIHEPRELIEDLDSLPMPDYDKINLDWYYSVMAGNRPDFIANGIKISKAKYANIISSRGCKGRCKFCSCFVHWGFRTRFRSAENIIKEIKYLYDRGIRLFQIADDSFGQDRNIAIDLCKGLIKSGIKIAWHTDMRADCADEDMLAWMKKSGCFAIAYGFESGSQKILDNLGKGITVEQIRNATELTKMAGINVYALLMVGNLGESDETIAETINLMNELKIDVWSTVGYVMVCPETVYYKMMKNKGLVDESYWLREEDGLPVFIEGFTTTDLKRWYMMMVRRIRNRW